MWYAQIWFIVKLWFIWNYRKYELYIVTYNIKIFCCAETVKFKYAIGHFTMYIKLYEKILQKSITENKLKI